jgi:hypothetical protein
MKASVERMEAKMDSNQEEMKTNQAKMDANLKEIIAEMRVWRKKMEAMEAYPEKMEARVKTNQEPVEAKIKTGLFEVEAMDLEANPKEKEVMAEQHGVPNEEAAVVPGLASSHRVLLKSEEMDPGRWWVPAEIGCCLRTVDPPCRSCTVQGTRSSGTRQGWCCMRNLCLCSYAMLHASVVTDISFFIRADTLFTT